jgi:ABC-type sugar transport system permease subunit
MKSAGMAITEVQSRERAQEPKKFRVGLSRLGPVVLLIPALASIGAVSVYPVFLGLWLSFRDTTLASPTDNFIGFGNYLQLFADSQFWNAWIHTIQFTFASTLFETAIGLMIALVLCERFRGRGIVRAAMLVPWAIPTVVTSKMFGWLFDGQNGIVNYFLRSLALIRHNVDWYGSPDFALTTIIIADVWKTTPFIALLLLAGLQTIPESLSEASVIDGANAWQRFWYVRLPLLAPT